MNITINVDETQFKEILDRELKDLPKEDLQEIIKQALTQYIMSNPELVKNLLAKNVKKSLKLPKMSSLAILVSSSRSLCLNLLPKVC